MTSSVAMLLAERHRPGAMVRSDCAELIGYLGDLCSMGEGGRKVVRNEPPDVCGVLP